MSRNRKLVKVIRKNYRKFCASIAILKKLFLSLLRTLLVAKRKPRSANAGFVLPTVAMVSIVVILLTVAIMIRSFERSKNASNVRVNEAVISAASPALDRAKAKIDKLFADPRLPRSTPSDLSLEQVLSGNVDEFTFGDETQLKLISNINDGKASNTAWKYPVDTDNDGKFDSYTLYGIYYQTPTTQRRRSTLEARTQPMDEGNVGSNKCRTDVKTSASLIGNQGWYTIGGKLKRSLFVYTANIPITDKDLNGIPTTEKAKYEPFTGNRGFAALEYQQDRERIPLNNNAVLYEDDLEIAPGAGINLNGRIFTNGNLLTTQQNSDRPVRFYLVSSPESCYYNEQNSKIIVAGNVINSRANGATFGNGVRVDLFDQTPNTSAGNAINGTQKTVPSAVLGTTAAYNDAAYAARIDYLVKKTIDEGKTLPDIVQKEIQRDITDDKTKTPAEIRDEQLKIYFRQRTRRVPYAELIETGQPNKDPLAPYKTGTPLEGNGNSLRPKDDWVFPYNPSDGKTATGYAKIGINENSNKLYLSATDPKVQTTLDKELLIGDRVLVGNNLPQYWYDATTNPARPKWVSLGDGAEQAISGKVWDNNTQTRKRFPQAFQLDDLGITDRDDFWEKSAAQRSKGALDIFGGLRIVTGAGIYLPNGYTPTSTTAQLTTATNATRDIVWPDTMPMGVTTAAQGLPNALTPYLQMRSTVVYHYQDDSYDPKNDPTNYQRPIACISSYYDPTSIQTAINRDGLIDIRPREVAAASINIRPLDISATVPNNTGGQSHNGVVYSINSASTLNAASYTNVLNYQANLKYPSGRYVNEQLKRAVEKGLSSGNLSLAEQSAVDSAVCSLKIMDNTIGSPDSTNVPHGAIYERAFLDARQVKAIDKPNSSGTYDLDVEFRQPLEVRTTVIDLDLLRRKSKGNNEHGVPEYLLPNTGIIYATRDDALLDATELDPSTTSGSSNYLERREKRNVSGQIKSDMKKEISATDFNLDPTRRPNGIMLINGARLDRQRNYRPEEKGLILASNLSVYIQAQNDADGTGIGYFNKHTQEEFTDKSLKTSTNWNDDFYSRAARNDEFACRPNQFGPGTCGTGETWRPASVIADSITILSNNFRPGFRQEGDYDLRDNAGYMAYGYDLNGINGIEAAPITLNENALKLDLNGNGNMTDTNVSTLDETKILADIDGDGKAQTTAAPIRENNLPAIVITRLNGFWDNNFVTSLPWRDNAGTPPNFGNPTDANSTALFNASSYFNNFVTPVQRRASFAEYVMEICRKPTVTACTADDWKVGYDAGATPDGVINWSNAAENLKAREITPNNASFTVNRLGAGTTARPALNPADRGFPRRIAFLRDGSDNLILTGAASNRRPIPLGIRGGIDNPTSFATVAFTSQDNIGQVNYYPFDSYTPPVPSGTTPITYNAYSAANRPRLHTRALWFKTFDAANAATPPNPINYGYNYPLWIENQSTLSESKVDQPLLVPVLQIQYPFITPGPNTTSLNDSGDVRLNGGWMQTAAPTETNLVFAQGNTPARPVETNGGLENFVRYLERWENVRHIAAGAFIQFKRSFYANAPWQVVTANYTNINNGFSSSGTMFGYPQGYRLTVNQTVSNIGRSPFYTAPTRFWGYDVALLTQLPDLFSLRFATPSVAEPNEYYREVGRDDDWVKTLLCAAQTNTTGGYETAPTTTYGNNMKYAIGKDQRPASCQ